MEFEDEDENLEEEKVVEKFKKEIKKPTATSNTHKTEAEKKREERKI